MITDGDALRRALAEFVDEPFLDCLTITHPDLAEPLRLVNDKVDLVRTAGTFAAFPFEVQDFARSDESIAEAVITADTVDQRIIEAMRSIQNPRPVVVYEGVFADAPNEVEHGPMTFEVQGFVADQGTIAMKVAFKLDMLGEAFPRDYFTPGNAGG